MRISTRKGIDSKTLESHTVKVMHLRVESADNNSGAVYVYKSTGTSWAQETYVKAANNDADDHFTIVALSGDTLAVGAKGEGATRRRLPYD